MNGYPLNMRKFNLDLKSTILRLKNAIKPKLLLHYAIQTRSSGYR